MDAASRYALPPEDFIAARDEASDATRAAGDPAAATAPKTLRRPSVAAWLVNRRTVGQPGLLDQLLGLGPALADPASAEAVRSGRLVRALSYAGFCPVEAVEGAAERVHAALEAFRRV